MYMFMLGNMLLPVTPAKIDIQTGNNNKSYTLINDSEVNVLKSTPLKTVSFEFELPTANRAYAMYKSAFIPATVFLDYIKSLKDDKEPFQLIITRYTNGVVGDFTNMTVSLEDYTVSEDADNGQDYRITVNLKEYKQPTSLLGQIINTVVGGASVATSLIKVVKTSTKTRNSKSSPLPKKSVRKYTVKQGDTLWSIAKKFYDDGSKYNLIVNANDIKNANLIYPKQVLTIPKVNN